MDPIVIRSGDVRAEVHDGRLVSLSRGGFEFFHGGGKIEELKSDVDRLGWQESEINMFPVVGPVAGYKLRTGHYTRPLDKHGISRALPWGVEDQTGDSVLLSQVYDGSSVANPKFKADGEMPKRIRVAPYRLTKRFEVNGDGLDTDFLLSNISGDPIRFDMGWHPAFRVLDGGRFYSARESCELSDVFAACASKGSYVMRDRCLVGYRGHEKEVKFETEGFSHLILWTPGEESGMFCIEPVTRIPERVGGLACLDSGQLADSLEPEEQRDYSVSIKIN